MTFKGLESAAMKLSAKDRSRLAARLLATLDQEDPAELEKLWIDEAERRFRAYRRGKLRATPARQALRVARASLKP